MEHSAIDLPTVQRLVATAPLTGLTLLVHVPRNDLNTALRALDIGANGVVFPHVNTKADAMQAVSATKYRRPLLLARCPWEIPRPRGTGSIRAVSSEGLCYWHEFDSAML